jgi:hypothetical protein
MGIKMGIVIDARWTLVNNWDFRRLEEWSETMILNEIIEVANFIKKSKLNVELQVFLRKIELDGSIQVKDKLINFGKLQDILRTWRHLTSTCKHYGRTWIAQDESKTGCFLKRYPSCSGYSPNCEDYKPLINGRSYEELSKMEEIVVFS